MHMDPKNVHIFGSSPLQFDREMFIANQLELVLVVIINAWGQSQLEELFIYIENYQILPKNEF